MLCLLQLPHQLLLLGLQLLQQHRALHLLPRLHEVRLLQDVQLQLLNTVNILEASEYIFPFVRYQICTIEPVKVGFKIQCVVHRNFNL